MRNLLSPRWIFIINTLPILILFFLCFGEYQIIKSLLEKETISLWKIFGLILGILVVLNFVYALILELKKKKVSAWYGAIALLLYIPFLYVYGNYADNFIPFSIPRWMVSGNILIYVGTFLMPTLFYSLILLVIGFTPENKEHKAWKSFVFAVAVPLFWYVFFQIITPLWRFKYSVFGEHIVIIFFICGTILFLFFLIRSVYILILKKGEKWKKYQLAWKIPIALVFPFLGLALNNGLIMKNFTYTDFIFGNFSDVWFYILAGLNGIVICMPNLENKIYRMILFIARCLTFSYTFYFFLVFLPYLPLSIIAVIAFGLGFLMLTPVVLLVIHVNELSKDFSYFNKHYSFNAALILSIMAFLVLPSAITINYAGDKRVLNKALEYVYNPDFSKTYNINKTSLRKTLDVITNHKKNFSRDFIVNGQTPYLSPWYNYIVLDNLMLSDSKHYRIENVFFGKSFEENQFIETRRDSVAISGIKSVSRFDKSQNAWISQIDIELTNKNTRPWPAEYITNFELPEGCYISDYYLYIGDRKETGILAEKKSAMWVFQQIATTNRDPGILYYLNGNRIAFRVFPFSKGEVRKTGIEFIHKEPVKLTIDSNIVELGNHAEQLTVPISESPDKGLIYIPAFEKQKLPLVQRDPYYHFIVDVSEGNRDYKEKYILQIDSLVKARPIEGKGAKISFAGTYTTTVPINENWKSALRGQHFEGGFFLDRAIKSILVESYKNKDKTYPVLVVITDNLNFAVIDNNISEYVRFCPESNYFYKLDYQGKFEVHSLISKPLETLYGSDKTNEKPLVRAYPNAQKPIAFLADDRKPSIVLKNELFDVDPKQIKEKSWQSAFLIQGKYLSQTLHPEIAGKEWLNLVKYSFMSGIMNPFTSYLVVENEAQKAVLKKKQEQVLAGNKDLDLNENITRMSEPGLLFMIVLLLVFLWIMNRRKLSQI